MHHSIRYLMAGALFAGALSQVPAVEAGPTVDLAFSGRHSELFAAGGDGMRIVLNNGNISKSIRVKAGMFSGAVTGAVDFDPATLYLDDENVLTYCVDILQGLRRASTSYAVNDIDVDTVVTDDGVRRDFGRMLTFLGAINHVLADGIYSLGFDERNWLNPTTGWMSGAIQVGIWESLYEEEGKRLSIGNTGSDAGHWFSATGVSNRGLTLLDQAFRRMGTATPLNVDLVKWLETDQGQDLVVDPVDVPVPAPLALLAVGAGLLSLRLRPSASNTPRGDQRPGDFSAVGANRSRRPSVHCR